MTFFDSFMNYKFPLPEINWESDFSLPKFTSFSNTFEYGCFAKMDIPWFNQFIPRFNMGFSEPIFNTYKFPSCSLNIDTFSLSDNFKPQPCFTPTLSPPKAPASVVAKANTSKSKTAVSKQTSRDIDNRYSKYTSTSEAEKAAAKDERLERLTSGVGWRIEEKSFQTDIPYARKGTSEILEETAKIVGHDLVITSALATGCAGNPHKRGGYISHHNAENPKIDIRANGNADELAKELRATGLFSHVYAEGTHVDVQISPEAYAKYA